MEAQLLTKDAAIQILQKKLDQQEVGGYNVCLSACLSGALLQCGIIPHPIPPRDEGIPSSRPSSQTRQQNGVASHSCILQTCPCLLFNRLFKKGAAMA